jgi:lipopolysaccharide biosynthesis regulator YciM
MLEFWPLLLPIAALSGYYVAVKQQNERPLNNTHQLSREYVLGLNYLLNEQPDKAVDVFIKLLDINSETVETHLALGSLFRRRGEVDRAIRIHQNLIARPQLSAIQRKDALMALGQDYMSAGVFDRAEGIFLEVLSIGGKELPSLQALLFIYQQEKAWESALDILDKIEKISGQTFHVERAHFHCELAEYYLQLEQLDLVEKSLKLAVNANHVSVRASILLARYYMKGNRFRKAIRYLKKVEEHQIDYFSEVVDLLVNCYDALNDMPACIQYLETTLKRSPNTSTMFVIADHIRKEKGLEQAIDFYAQALSNHPSIRGLNKLIYWHLMTAQGKVKLKLQMLYDITTRLLENKPIYRCNHCGFCGKHLHWNCPSCKQWEQMKPIYGLEGD